MGFITIRGCGCIFKVRHFQSALGIHPSIASKNLTISYGVKLYFEQIEIEDMRLEILRTNSALHLPHLEQSSYGIANSNATHYHNVDILACFNVLMNEYC